jgi:hypothetical protein
MVVLSLAACARAATPGGERPAPLPALPDVPPAAAAPADALPPEFAAAFAIADTRARAVVYWLQCVGTVARMRAQGSFGAAANAPKAIHCERTDDGVPIGGVYDIDSAYRTVRRLALVRLDGARPRHTAPLDTQRIAQQARLARDVHRTIATAWTRRNRPFTIVPITLRGSPEAWVIPRANRARSFVTGGDVGYALASDGTPRLVEDRAATWTQLTLPASGPITIYSSVRDVAAVADLVTARWHTDLGREVRVSTPVAVSALVAGLDSTTGARVVWQHTARSRTP